MDSTVSDSLVGRLLDGRYRVESRIARGGMATVYAALDTRLERVVALKVMHPVFADDEEFVARFIREAKSAARLSHPNVVAVFDQGEDAGHVFLAMEYVHGRTLRDLIRERGRLAPQEALSILAPVLSALAAAHAAGLIHRDVKPENVLLADDGRVKVADFGLARAMAGRQTTTSTLIGTVAYLAPEQITRGVADARTDVYSAGVVLFEMVTGQPPYDGDTPISVAYRHAHEDVPPPSSLVDGIPATLDALVVRATARDPDQRPADAAAFLTQVQRVRRSLPALEADGDSATTFTPRGQQTLIVDLAEGEVRPHGGPPPGAVADLGYDDEEPPAPRRRRTGLIAFFVILVLAAALAVAGWWYGTADTRNARHYTLIPSVISTANDPVTLAEAKSMLTSRDLAIKVAPSTDADYSETVPKDDVINQTPVPTSIKVRKGSTITVEVSLGPQRTTVPPFDPATTTLTGYEAQLAQAKLLYSTPVVQQYDPSVPANNVLSADPAPGTSQKLNTKIAITVSKGPAPVAIPNVINKKQSDAEQVLTTAGFLIAEKQDYSTTVPTGSVINQLPYSDKFGKKGDTVTIDISKGPQLFPVPNVSSDLANPTSWISISEAEEKLSAAGFKVAVSGRGVFGVVTSQNPKKGTLEPAGFTVTITAH